MTRRAAAAAACLCLAACFGTPQGLPVSLSVCSAIPSSHGLEIVTRVGNRSTKPIARLDLVAAFYQNFRYERYHATASLNAELDPGDARDVTLAVLDAPNASLRGQAIHCYATHVGYLDGTSDDAPPDR
ncbi:MAG TPA: hypothetical protein VGZ02_00740 [Candidatus Baltobacteraceae bacterium]|nr:hypothetical protein [Candidatus Baltobacteraceae bacterium]